MKKGFTLVELLAVVVIIAIVSGIGIVAFSALTKKSDANYYASLANNLELGASNYFSNYRSKRPGIGEVCSRVSLQDLVNEKFVDSALDVNGESCDLGNSFVYIKRNSNSQYEYKASIKCDDYEAIVDEVDYCTVVNVVESTILLTAHDPDNNNYSVTSSYANTQWTNKDITVNFDSEETVTKYIITNTATSDVYTCDATANKCSLSFNKNGVYVVVSYNNDARVSERSFNLKIDKTAPTFTLENNEDLTISYGNQSLTYENNIVNVNDESGVYQTNFIISKSGAEIINNTVTGTSIKAANLPSGRYTIKVKVYDRALNESSYLEKDFVITRKIKLIDPTNAGYDAYHTVIDGTNYNSLGVSLPTLSKSGYTFKGWYTTSTGGTEIINNALASATILALYARWE